MKPQNGKRRLDEGERLEQGHAYTVKRFNGVEDDECQAEIVQIKTCNFKDILEFRKERGILKSSQDAEPVELNGGGDESAENEHQLYYIHYGHLDRRHDEWVERDRFVEFLSDSGLPQNKTDGDPENDKRTTRSVRRFQEEFFHRQPSYQEMDATTALLEKEHAKRTLVKNIQKINIGGLDLRVWYYSPYPKYVWGNLLYVCEFCLMYTPDKERFACHRDHQCKVTQPPGKAIYRDGKIVVYEVDGKESRFYCQCLCLLSKLFMDHKTLYYDVDTFLFYVLCEVSENGSRLAGHFSKERNSNNNLACIMVLPSFQRKGYGQFLIQLSYELSKREGWVGTPERPLSDLGKVSYRSYWWWRIINVWESMNPMEDMVLKDFAYLVGIDPGDFYNTLLTVCAPKACRGLKKGYVPVDSVLRFQKAFMDYVKRKFYVCPKLLLKPECLNWTPTELRQDGRSSSVDSV